MPSVIWRPSAAPFWRDPDKRAIVFQVVALLVVAVVSYYLFANTQANLERQSIATGFGFLENEAGFLKAFWRDSRARQKQFLGHLAQRDARDETG